MTDDLNKAIYEDVRQAVMHIDDPPYLENLSLAQRIAETTGASGVSRGTALRRALLLAIAALDPGCDPANAVGARAYQVLYRYAVSRQSTVAIGTALGISRRHVYRQLGQAYEALTSIVEDMLHSSSDQTKERKPAETAGSGLLEELERLSASPKVVDMVSVFDSCLEDARLLAERRGKQLVVRGTEIQTLEVMANHVMLRQVILNLLSHTIRVGQGNRIEVRLSGMPHVAHMSIRYAVSMQEMPHEGQDTSAVAISLLDRMGLTWEKHTTHDGQSTLEIAVPRVSRSTVLIVDDNPGLVQLIRRYLKDQPFVVHNADTVDMALGMIATLHPDIILLDVMMPDRDGWELLRSLRRAPNQQTTKIIVCSIIHDPELAAALGADAFLKKPVDQARLLDILTSDAPADT